VARVHEEYQPTFVYCLGASALHCGFYVEVKDLRDA